MYEAFITILSEIFPNLLCTGSVVKVASDSIEFTSSVDDIKQVISNIKKKMIEDDSIIYDKNDYEEAVTLISEYWLTDSLLEVNEPNISCRISEPTNEYILNALMSIQTDKSYEHRARRIFRNLRIRSEQKEKNYF